MSETKNCQKISLLFVIILISAITLTACSTAGKAKKPSRCDCPTWSNIVVEKQKV